MLKIFIAEYGWSPSDPHKSVVIAENITEAERLIVTEFECDRPWWSLVFVDTNPADYDYDTKAREVRLTEIEMTAGVIYTGDHCC